VDSPGTARTVTLSMENDRARTTGADADASAGGSGLRGLGERLSSLGGTITTQHPRGGHFRLEASLPACAGAAALPATREHGARIGTDKPAS